MNYYLEANSGREFVNIDLSSVVKNSKSLESIDSITTNFKDEDSFIIYLIQNDLLKPTYLKSKLNITYIYNKEKKKLPVFYTDKKKYLDFNSLRMEYYRLLSDKEFLNRLLYEYSYLKTPDSPLSDIEIYLKDVAANGGNDFPSTLFDVAVRKFFEQITFRYDRNSQNFKFNYKGARDFGNFIDRYNKKKELKKASDSFKGNDDLTQLKLI